MIGCQQILALLIFQPLPKLREIATIGIERIAREAVFQPQRITKLVNQR